MAKDIFHNTVKTALQKDGWLITHDPYPLRYGVTVIERYEIRLVIYNPNKEFIDQWIE